MDRYYSETIFRSLDSGKIQGTASVFYSGQKGTEFQLSPKLVERIAPGAFDQVLRNNPDVVATYEHETKMPLARTPDLKLWTDNQGLQFEFDLPKGVSYADDLKQLIDRGIVRGCSFAARIGYRTFDKEGEKDVCTIHRFSELADVAVCVKGAYGAAVLRSKDSEEMATQEYQQWLETKARLERWVKIKAS